MATVTITGVPKFPVDFQLAGQGSGFVGILTATPPGVCSSVGDPVQVVTNGFWFPKTGTFCSPSAGYRARLLAPGEVIEIRA